MINEVVLTAGWVEIEQASEVRNEMAKERIKNGRVHPRSELFGIKDAVWSKDVGHEGSFWIEDFEYGIMQQFFRNSSVHKY